MVRKNDNYEVLDNLKARIDNNDLIGIFLFTGEEKYLKDRYIEKIKNIYLKTDFPEFNVTILTGDNLNATAMQNAFESLPVMSDRKLIIIKGSGIFKSAKEELKDVCNRLFDDPPDYATIIFDESDVDGRSTLLKKIKSTGVFAEFLYYKSEKLVEWVTKEFRKSRISIDKNTIYHLIEFCPPDMSSIKNEIDKLVAFAMDKGHIKLEDIELVVQKSVENKIFEIVDKIIEKKTDIAIYNLFDLKKMNESPIKIITIISRHINILFKAKLMLKNHIPVNAMAKELGVPPYFVNKYISQANMISEHKLYLIQQECANTDASMKRGQLEHWTALELFVAFIIN